MDSFIDFSQMPSPTPASSRLPASSSSSTITSPTNTVIPLDQSDDFQTPAKPSHEYERFKQQTGLPSNSVPGLQTINKPFNGGYQQMFSNSGTGLDEASLMGSSSMLDAGWNTGLGMGSDVNMELDLSLPSSTLPAYFYPSGDASQSDDFIDPSAITTEQETFANIRVWPGMHQQQAAIAKAQAQAQQQRQQQLAQQQQQKQRAAEQQQARLQPARRNGSHQVTDARTEETIARVVNQIRQNSTLSSQGDSMSPGGVLPHIARMKKDEEDMDEDERLLASEEGKKLSSKERRQLRNKVSARAFRSRRKEYIGQLEGEVAMKTNECNELRSQNRALMEENARSRAFIERLLRHQAFTPFLEELSRDESLDIKPAASTSSAVPTPTPAPTRKDVNPYSSQQYRDFSQNENPQIGMALIPETPLDLSMLNLNNNWAMANMGFNFQQPQVYSVMELPEGPSNPIDTDLLSGKSGDSFVSQISTVEEVKTEYPVIERPIEREEPTQVATAEAVEDDGNPEFDLFRSSPIMSASAPTSIVDSEPIFGDADPEKVFAHFELFIADEAESQMLLERFEKMCALVEPVFQRIQAMTSHLDL